MSPSHQNPPHPQCTAALPVPSLKRLARTQDGGIFVDENKDVLVISDLKMGWADSLRQYNKRKEEECKASKLCTI